MIISNESKQSAILSNPNGWHVVRVDDGYILGVFIDVEEASTVADDHSRRWGRRFVAQPNE